MQGQGVPVVITGVRRWIGAVAARVFTKAGARILGTLTTLTKRDGYGFDWLVAVVSDENQIYQPALKTAKIEPEARTFRC